MSSLALKRPLPLLFEPWLLRSDEGMRLSALNIGDVELPVCNEKRLYMMKDKRALKMMERL